MNCSSVAPRCSNIADTMISFVTLLVVVAMAGVAIGERNECICPFIYAPVCASNGKTFPSACSMSCHNVENNEHLTVVSQGPCTPFTKLIKKLEDQEEDICICTREYMPVCGSDHQMYDNKCVLRCAAKKNPGLTEVPEDECNTKPVMIQEVENQNENICICTMEYMPVCGSDHQMYANKCLLKCAAKKYPGLTVVSEDNCDSKPVMIEKFNNPCLCTREYLPVCGSDHQTYANRCLFRCAAKKHPGLTVVSEGRCDSKPVMIQEFKNQKEDLCVCTREYEPVCGSDHLTYPNLCLLKCAAKKYPGLTVVSEDNCDTKPNMFQEYEKQNEDLCPCTREYRPVCGSDLNTYANKCLLKCAAKRNNKLHMLYPMVCIVLP